MKQNNIEQIFADQNKNYRHNDVLVGIIHVYSRRGGVFTLADTFAFLSSSILALSNSRRQERLAQYEKRSLAGLTDVDILCQHAFAIK